MKTVKNIEKGSALLVTIMITGIVLIVAMTLLGRIIPYGKQIRSMQDSLQAYYSARGEIEVGKLQFKKENGELHFDTDSTIYLNRRVNIDPDNRIDVGAPPLTLKTPDLGSTKSNGHVVVALNEELPMNIYLFENDATAQSFGTNPGDPSSHILDRFGNGLTFDLSGVDTGGGFSLSLLTAPSVTGKIEMEFVYSDLITDFPFFGTIALGASGSTDLMRVTNSDGDSLGGSFLPGKNCESAHCYMKLSLSGAFEPLPMKLKSNRAIPDINAVIIADSLSKNSLYHSRIVELIPVAQSI